MLPKLTCQTVINILTMLATVFAALYTKHQATIAKKQYHLSLQIYNNSTPNIRMLSNETGLICIDTQSEFVYFCIPVSIYNLSSSSTSIVEPVLTLYCDNDLKYKPEYYKINTTSPDIKKQIKQFHVLSQDTFIKENGSIAGWYIFQLPQYNYSKINISSFKLTVKDINNNHKSIQTQLLKEELINYEI